MFTPSHGIKKNIDTWKLHCWKCYKAWCKYAKQEKFCHLKFSTAQDSDSSKKITGLITMDASNWILNITFQDLKWSVVFEKFGAQNIVNFCAYLLSEYNQAFHRSRKLKFLILELQRERKYLESISQPLNPQGAFLNRERNWGSWGPQERTIFQNSKFSKISFINIHFFFSFFIALFFHLPPFLFYQSATFAFAH